MEKTWGPACGDVALCLSVVQASPTMADVRSFACLTVRPLRPTARQSSAFIVERRDVEIHTRALDANDRNLLVATDEKGLALVRKLRILGVSCDGRVVGRPLASR